MVGIPASLSIMYVPLFNASVYFTWHGLHEFGLPTTTGLSSERVLQRNARGKSDLLYNGVSMLDIRDLLRL